MGQYSYSSMYVIPAWGAYYLLRSGCVVASGGAFLMREHAAEPKNELFPTSGGLFFPLLCPLHQVSDEAAGAFFKAMTSKREEKQKDVLNVQKYTNTY